MYSDRICTVRVFAISIEICTSPAASVLHFVDGSAFSLYGRGEWDPSIPEERRSTTKHAKQTPASEAKKQTHLDDQDNPGAEGEGEQDDHDAAAHMQRGGSMLDVFYLYGSEKLSTEENQRRLREIVLAKRAVPNEATRGLDRQQCGILPDVSTAHSGRAWIGKTVGFSTEEAGTDKEEEAEVTTGRRTRTEL